MVPAFRVFQHVGDFNLISLESCPTYKKTAGTFPAVFASKFPWQLEMVSLAANYSTLMER